MVNDQHVRHSVGRLTEVSSSHVGFVLAPYLCTIHRTLFLVANCTYLDSCDWRFCCVRKDMITVQCMQCCITAPDMLHFGSSQLQHQSALYCQFYIAPFMQWKCPDVLLHAARTHTILCPVSCCNLHAGHDCEMYKVSRPAVLYWQCDGLLRKCCIYVLST